ncbi:hypothetical protein [Sphingobium sp. Z007]
MVQNCVVYMLRNSIDFVA